MSNLTDQQNNQLYFIALVPDNGLGERVRILKEEMKARFNSSHALKSPAHITLQMPFRKKEIPEEAMIQCLQNFAGNERPCTIELNGFDSFPPRVVFIKIEDHQPLIELHGRLKRSLLNEIGLNYKNSYAFHPHMTIATRDLSEKDFSKAWPEFQKRQFRALFVAKSLFLLKHNGTFWDIYKEFEFDI